LSGQEWRLVAIQVAAQDSSHLWETVRMPSGESWVTLEKKRDYRSLAPAEIAAAVYEALESYCPGTVVANGWRAPEARAALLWAKGKGRRSVLMSTAHRGSVGKNPVKQWLRRRLVSSFDAALVGGSRHKEYLMSLGMAADRIHLGYNTVDNEYFAAAATAARRGEAKLRDSTGLRRSYFLCPCRFIPDKDLPGLFAAYERYADAAGERHRWDLVVCGDGPQAPILERLRSESPFSDALHMVGFQPYDKLPAYYAWAGALVLASRRETWGLVINEAMASGLPIIVSDACGATPDLVEDGINGFVFEPGDIHSLSDLMLRMSAASPERWAEMSQSSRARIAAWPLERFAKGLLGAVESAAHGTNSSPDPIAGLILRSPLRK
jgi:glycosyltransferase involved in cell wall biosynthesis